MNALVIYYSKFGNTKQLAETIAETLRYFASVRVMSFDEMKIQDFKGVDLVIAGSPTHVSNVPRDLRPILEALPKRTLKGARIAAFDTSYKMNRFICLFTASKQLKSKLRKAGGKPIVPAKTFFVVDKDGPLYDGELENARSWAGEIIDRYKS